MVNQQDREFSALATVNEPEVEKQFPGFSNLTFEERSNYLRKIQTFRDRQDDIYAQFQTFTLTPEDRDTVKTRFKNEPLKGYCAVFRYNDKHAGFLEKISAKCSDICEMIPYTSKEIHTSIVSYGFAPRFQTEPEEKTYYSRLELTTDRLVDFLNQNVITPSFIIPVIDTEGFYFNRDAIISAGKFDLPFTRTIIDTLSFFDDPLNEDSTLAPSSMTHCTIGRFLEPLTKLQKIELARVLSSCDLPAITRPNRIEIMHHKVGPVSMDVETIVEIMLPGNR